MSKDTVQPQPSLRDQFQSTLARIKSDLGKDARELGYQESGHAWQVVELLGESIEIRYASNGDSPELNQEVVDILLEINSYGGKLEKKGSELFEYRIKPWFLREIARSSGMQESERASVLEERFKKMASTLGSEDVELILASLDNRPIQELESYINKSSSLLRGVLDLILTLDGDEEIKFNERPLRDKKDKDLFLILFNVLTRMDLSQDVRETVSKIREDQSKGYYIYPFTLMKVIGDGLNDPRAINGIWKILTD